jgi:hypothetical protein
MKRHLEIEIPYSRPLTIGVGISTSTKSWGDVEETEWPAPLLTGNQPARNIIIPA